jgi:hypothetical protein
MRRNSPIRSLTFLRLAPAGASPRRRAVAAVLLAAAPLAALAALAACTLQPTPYQPLGEAGGYEEARLQPQVYRVSFRGNRATPETTVLDFLYLRCAELTEQAGFTQFAIQEDFGRTQASMRPGPQSSVGVGLGFGSPRSFWSMGFGAPLAEPDYQFAVDYHLGVFVIRMLSDAEAKGAQGPVYDAAYLIHSLAAKKEASLRKGS